MLPAIVAIALYVVSPSPTLAQCAPEPLVSPAGISPYSAVPSQAWTDLFDRNEGWTGADGVYTIPLSGVDLPCSAFGEETFWTFSDTFIGSVSADGRREPGWALINNTMALLDGGDPNPENIRFYWRGGDDPAAIVEPLGEGLIWPQDGIVVGDFLYLYGIRIITGLEIGAVVLLRTDTREPLFREYDQIEPSRLYKEQGNSITTFSRAILDNTAASGAPDPDGYIYLYGLREAPFQKSLKVARFLPEEIERLDLYRFWDGSGWSEARDDAVSLVEGLSAEFSVSALADGRVILVYEENDFIGGEVTVRIGESPVGPWSDPVKIWDIPETNFIPGLFAYGAKAHPHLSTPDRLLISYHVNTFNFVDHIRYADIYRPRFIELPLR